MVKKCTAIDPQVGRIVSAIDAASFIPVSVQLRGALEFGIASGDLPDGHRLPSVRTLAREVGLSPVTVSGVYAALQRASLLEGRSGSGSFVRASGQSGGRRKLAEIDLRIGDLVALGQGCGLTPSDLALRVSMAQPVRSRPVAILMVGNFHDATEGYAAEIRAHLRAGDTIATMLLPDFETRGTGTQDLILAPQTLLAQIAAMEPNMTAVGVTLIPNEATRVGLAALSPETRVLGYSIFPGFVPIMKSGIQRFAPHIRDLAMVVRGEAAEDVRIAQADVVVYASGAEDLLDRLQSGQSAVEYRHTPDVQSIRADVLPAIEACRMQPSSRREAAE